MGWRVLVAISNETCPRIKDSSSLLNFKESNAAKEVLHSQGLQLRAQWDNYSSAVESDKRGKVATEILEPASTVLWVLRD